MNRSLTLLAASLTIVATMLVATACSGTTDAEPTAAETPTASPTSPEPTPEVTASTEPMADPTCETIIPAATIADFEDVGWTSRSETFRVGEIELADGVQCVWGDFTTATDHVQIYGWAPVTAEQAVDAQNQLIALGWTREETPNGVIITESPETTIATDDEGYGLTYLFGEGWVKYADTKQGLLLVVWPSP